MKKHFKKNSEVFRMADVRKMLDIKRDWLGVLVVLVFLLVGWFIQSAFYQNEILSDENLSLLEETEMLESAYSSTLSLLRSTEVELVKYKKELGIMENQVNLIAQNLGAEKKKTVELSGEVDVLEKLTTIDSELLKKYSKVFFLNENYSPKAVLDIPKENRYFEDRDASILAEVWPYLQNLLLAAKKENIVLYVYSSYRSFGTQAQLKSRYKVIYGEGTANKFSADQGYSEHQMGTTVDFITTGLSGQLYGFNETESFKWLEQNAYKYGFVLSYPEKNDYYIFEPWHWRFVGVRLATDLYNNGKYFYDMDQREIDEYLLYLFD